MNTMRDGGPVNNTGPSRSRGDGPVVKVCAYLSLFLLGLVQGVIGTFQYSRGPGVLVAICFDLAILTTSVLGARGMRSAAGGVLPAAGWFLATLVLSSASAGGSVLITNTPAGKWFLFGGAIGAAGGAVMAFARWARVRPARGPHPPVRRPGGR